MEANGEGKTKRSGCLAQKQRSSRRGEACSLTPRKRSGWHLPNRVGMLPVASRVWHLPFRPGYRDVRPPAKSACFVVIAHAIIKPLQPGARPGTGPFRTLPKSALITRSEAALAHAAISKTATTAFPIVMLSCRTIVREGAMPLLASDGPLVAWL